ncbi:MAG: hypothetical protein PHG66_03270 [Candidatus Colwellbacteria bacterium]|nr:hypothetical protein [Candidatus Colwellbacteria bacterium]
MIKIDIKEKKKAPEGEWSTIFDYREDIEKLRKAVKQYSGRKLVVIGNGGSITSFRAYRDALRLTDSSVIVWTMDPDYIAEVRKNFPAKDSVVVIVSKSGEDIGPIEELLAFPEYETVVVTENKESALRKMAEKAGWMIIDHPHIGGRFSGGTSSALVPAIIAGMDVEELVAGMRLGYSMRDEAYSLAENLFKSEQSGYIELYTSIYASLLSGFEDLFIQLMHESVCKEGKGQTVYVAFGPDSQHHTNERLFGGRKNICVLFITVENPQADIRISIPEVFHNVTFKGGKIGDLDGENLKMALNAEYLGTKMEADNEMVPNFTISLNEITSKSIGELTAFMHLLAFYSAKIRGVDPFDQPAVERSKNITFEILAEENDDD